MERIEILNYQGKEIIYLDFSDLGVQTYDELKATVDSGISTIKARPLDSVLTLVNFTNLRFSSQIVADLKELTSQNKPYVKKGAVIGVQGIQKVAFDSVMKLTGRNLPIFDNKEEAMEWLVTD